MTSQDRTNTVTAGDCKVNPDAWLRGCDGMAWVGLRPDELKVLADYACASGHPDAELLAKAASE